MKREHNVFSNFVLVYQTLGEKQRGMYLNQPSKNQNYTTTETASVYRALH